MTTIINNIYLGPKPKSKLQQAKEIIEWLGDNLPHTVRKQVKWMKKANKARRLMNEDAEEFLARLP